MDYEIFLSLISLIALQNLIGINNEVYISILTDKLSGSRKKNAKMIGIAATIALKLGLLFAVNTLLLSESELLRIKDQPVSFKQVIYIFGGVFLIFSSIREIYRKTELEKTKKSKSEDAVSFIKVVANILIMNLVFSIESIITAVGVANRMWVMYSGVFIGLAIMLLAAGRISKYINTHPSLKILAFCFLFIIGFTLISEGMGAEIRKIYIYFVMIFAVAIDFFYMKKYGRKISPS